MPPCALQAQFRRDFGDFRHHASSRAVAHAEVKLDRLVETQFHGPPAVIVAVIPEVLKSRACCNSLIDRIKNLADDGQVGS